MLRTKPIFPHSQVWASFNSSHWEEGFDPDLPVLTPSAFLAQLLLLSILSSNYFLKCVSDLNTSPQKYHPKTIKFSDHASKHLYNLINLSLHPNLQQFILHCF